MEHVLSALLDYFSASVPTGEDWRPATLLWLAAFTLTVLAAVAYFLMR